MVFGHRGQIVTFGQIQPLGKVDLIDYDNVKWPSALERLLNVLQNLTTVTQHIGAGDIQCERVDGTQCKLGCVC